MSKSRIATGDLRKQFALFGILMLLPIIVWAQDSTRTGIRYGFLPIASFNSDNGIILGGEVQRYDYRGQTLPFNSYTRISTNYSTDGAFSLYIFRDQVQTFDTDVRAGFDIFTNQSFGNYFLGDTELYDFENTRFENTDFYTFKSFRVNTGAFSRFPLSLDEGISRIDLKTGLRVVYETPWGTPQNRFINQEKITGHEGAFLTFLELALVIERRNAEFRAQEGFLIEFGSKVAPPGISTHVTAENYLRALGFMPISFPLLKSLTLASRFTLQNTIGDTPYWFVPALGGSDTIRGVMFRRFASENAVSYSIELRSWVFSIPFKNIELGMNIFVDGGRVYRNDDWSSLFKEHNLALGFGGVMSIFTPDFILKYDLGFSAEEMGLYLGTGYSF